MNQTDILARKILYHEFPKHYVWSKDKKKWKPREKRNAIIGRMYFVHPGEGERFYLRLLLNHVPGAQNFDDIKSCNGIIHNTFKDAAQKRGLLESDSEWDSCLNEASSKVFGKKLRLLFGYILLFNEPSDPSALWHKYKNFLAED